MKSGNTEILLDCDFVSGNLKNIHRIVDLSTEEPSETMVLPLTSGKISLYPLEAKRAQETYLESQNKVSGRGDQGQKEVIINPIKLGHLVTSIACEYPWFLSNPQLPENQGHFCTG